MAGCGRICSSIFFFISFTVGSVLWVPTIHAYPSGSTGTLTNLFHYPAREFDQETGLDYSALAFPFLM